MEQFMLQDLGVAVRNRPTLVVEARAQDQDFVVLFRKAIAPNLIADFTLARLALPLEDFRTGMKVEDEDGRGVAENPGDLEGGERFLRMEGNAALEAAEHRPFAGAKIENLSKIRGELANAFGKFFPIADDDAVAEREVVVMGNRSGQALQYRAGRRISQVDLERLVAAVRVELGDDDRFAMQESDNCFAAFEGQLADQFQVAREFAVKAEAKEDPHAPGEEPEKTFAVKHVPFLFRAAGGPFGDLDGVSSFF